MWQQSTDCLQNIKSPMNCRLSEAKFLNLMTEAPADLMVYYLSLSGQ